MAADTVPFLLDTSALIAYLADEDGADVVARHRRKSTIPFMAMSELYYLVARRQGKAEADRIYALVKSWDLPMAMPNERIIITAGRLKATYRMGIADSYIAACALDENAVLLTKDDDFAVLEHELRVRFI